MKNKFLAITFMVIASSLMSYSQDAGRDISISTLYPFSKYDNILRNLNRSGIDTKTGRPNKSYKPLTMLYFADIHNDKGAMKRILEFDSIHHNHIDEMFVNGDIAQGCWSDYSKELDSMLHNHPILCSIGNHDTYEYAGSKERATSAQCYDRYFANIGNWGVTQPAENNTLKKCYYYKDYPISKIRFIVLDVMHYDVDQRTWFQNTLKDARENGLSVVAAQHIVADYYMSEKSQLFDCSFTSIDYDENGEFSRGQLEDVDQFVLEGGEFVCWLFGHAHSDRCGFFTSESIHSKQVFFITAASTLDTVWQDCDRNWQNAGFDLFNLISFDVYSKTITIKRVGCEYDRFMRHKGELCVDYKNAKVLWNS